MISAYSEEHFSTTFLPSHDHTHHHRVWNICKSLLKEISTINSLIDQSLVEGVLIAALFHDLGMVQSTREDHGKLGRELCHVWFEKGAKEPPSRFNEVLEAIEQHDIKDQLIYSAIQHDKRPGILSILSIADDLEALGTIGIYRYAEIYLQRNIGMSELGSRIRENAGTRFKNLSKTCAACKTVINNYQQQYAELDLFYKRYNQQLEKQLKQEPQAYNTFTAYVGVVNYIRTLGIEAHIRPENFIDKIEDDLSDSVVKDYFRTLKNELDQKRL